MYYKKKQSKPRYVQSSKHSQGYSHPQYSEGYSDHQYSQGYSDHQYSQGYSYHQPYYQQRSYGKQTQYQPKHYNQYDSYQQSGQYYSEYDEGFNQEQNYDEMGWAQQPQEKVKYQKKSKPFESYAGQASYVKKASTQPAYNQEWEESKEGHWERRDFQENYYDQEKEYEGYQDFEGYQDQQAGDAVDYGAEDYEEYEDYYEGSQEAATSAKPYQPKEQSRETTKTGKGGSKFERRPGYERPQFSADYGKKFRSVTMPQGKTTLLMVAEKPSIATAIAQALGGGKGRSSIHILDYNFMGRPARIKVTSVTGHLYRREFHRKYADRQKTDPLDLYDAETVRLAEKRSKGICKMLQNQSKSAHWLILWLDCDREGENICYEVTDNVSQHLKDSAHILRARFSSIAPADLRAAYQSLSDGPNLAESLSVDARQIIDLKIGVSVSRMQTLLLSPEALKIACSGRTRMVTYGPCQTPTLGFCVDQAQKVGQFLPQKYWTIKANVKRGDTQISLKWMRGRLFNRTAAQYFQSKVEKAGKEMIVQSITERTTEQKRPVGLNTVQLLKTASSSFGMSADHTMRVAQSLYLRGIITYPRTESTAYTGKFGFDSVLSSLRKSTEESISSFAKKITHATPRKGVDVGDHPPITPVQAASGLMGDQLKLYKFISQYFLASISENAKYKEIKGIATLGEQKFQFQGRQLLYKGFLEVMPWLSVGDKDVPSLTKGEALSVQEVVMVGGLTQAPSFLSEADLIGRMEKNGIGTDASIPTHIANIIERGYVKVQSPGRKLVPTDLGLMMVRAYMQIDPELVLPTVRSNIERSVALIAKGKAECLDVLTHVLSMFKKKFIYFRDNISTLDSAIRNPVAPQQLTEMQSRQKESTALKFGQALSFCPKCSKGLLAVGIKDKAGNNVVQCNLCSFKFGLMKNAKVIVRASTKCEECGSFEVIATFFEGKSPFPDLFSTGCLFCDSTFSSLLYKL